MSTYRVGLIGCGGISRAHMSGYSAIPEAQVVAAADMNVESLSNFAEQWSIPHVFTDYQEMLASVQPDLVSVTTWENSHCEIVIAAAESGVRGILCEKPMALSLEEADLMIDVCQRAGVKLLIGHMRRYNPFYRRAKELLNNGHLGTVEFMRAYCRGWDLFLWGTHYADMLCFLNNDVPVEWLMGQISYRAKGMQYPYSELYRTRRGDLFVAEDDAFGYMGFANGVRAMLETGIHAPNDWAARGTLGGECEVTIFGELGSMVVADGHLSYCTTQTGQWVEDTPPDMPDREDRFAAQFTAEIKDLIHSVEHGEESQLSGQRGRAALEILMAIYESSRARTVIQFPVMAQDNPFLSMVEEGAIP